MNKHVDIDRDAMQAFGDVATRVVADAGSRAFPAPGVYSPEQMAGAEERYEERLEYEARCVVRDLARIHGFDGAHSLLASIIRDEAERAH